jgi:alpha-tubulin suppressor-like RCC1 family protein
MVGAHACALATTGAAYCWGDNSDGDLGSGSYSTTGATPVAVTGGLTFNTILAGGASTCAYTTANAMYCWGGNQAQQLGLSAAADSEYAAPVPVPGMTGG